MKINIPDFKTDGLPKLICITTMEDEEQGKAVYSVEMEDGHYEKKVLSSLAESLFLDGYDMGIRHANEVFGEWLKQLMEANKE